MKSYAREHGRDPLAEIEPALRHAWGAAEASLQLSWPLSLRVGKMPESSEVQR